MLTTMPILMYHSLYEARPHAVGVAVHRFEAHMEWLARHAYRGVAMRDYRRDATPRCVCLTFDDGYRNNIDLALPILERYGFSATFFVLADPEAGPLPWHAADPQPLMRPEDWRQLADAGHEVASHGLSHRDLRRLSADDRRRELMESRRRLEESVGNVAGYAYPFGAFDETCEKMVADTYDYACATRYGWPPRETRWRFRRIGVNRKDGLRRFACKLSAPARLLFDFGI